MSPKSVAIAVVSIVALAAASASGAQVGTDDWFWGDSITQLNNVITANIRHFEGSIPMSVVQGWLDEDLSTVTLGLIAPAPTFYGNGQLPIQGVWDSPERPQGITITTENFEAHELRPVQAAHIKQDNLDFNDHTSLRVTQENGRPRPVLYEFDLTGITGTEVVLDASVHFEWNWSEPEKYFDMYQLNSDWDMSTVTYRNLVYSAPRPPETTAPQTGATVGVDGGFWGSSVGRVGSPLALQKHTGAILDTVVQGWLDDPSSNKGIALIPDAPSYYGNAMLASHQAVIDETTRYFRTLTLWFDDGTSAEVLLADSAMVKSEEPDFNFGGENIPVWDGVGERGDSFLKPQNGGPHPVLYYFDLSEHAGKTLMPGTYPTLDIGIHWGETNRYFNIYSIPNGWDGSTVTYASLLAGPSDIPGDANGDGLVTDADYTIWADNYGATDATFAMGDFNGDGEVTDADYTIWADNYGHGVTAVPEPVTVSVLGLASLALVHRRR